MAKLILVLHLLVLTTLAFAKKSGDVTELQIGVKKHYSSMTMGSFTRGRFIQYNNLLAHEILNPSKREEYKPASCEIQAHKGDTIKVHYRGSLTDGTVFDSSFEKNNPIQFELGGGRVIKGWDQGLLGMCVGEKRKLKIPSKLGYGDQGSPPVIPGGATLIFDTELVSVNGQPSNGSKDENKGFDDSDL